MTDQTKTPIMGEAKCKPEQMKKFLLKTNPKPKINCTVDELVNLYLLIGTAEGVRGDLAFAQSIKETGYWRFGGQVLPEQNNFGGLGAVNNAPVGKAANFKTPEAGIRAQIQHLKAYASKEPLRTHLVDPRFTLVPRGIAPHWEDLNGKWAVPGVNYGQKIVAIWQEILSMATTDTQEPKPPQGPFKDIQGRWSEQYILQLWKAGIISDGEQFRPTQSITREEVAAMLARLLDYLQK